MATKICGRCKKDLPEEAYSPSQFVRSGAWCRECSTEYSWERRNGVIVTPVFKACLNCGKDISHMRSHAKWCSTSCSMKGFRAANPGHSRWYVLKCVYGIDQGAYDAMMLSQGGLCAICKCELVEDLPRSNPRQINIDHDHETGVVRGLLCSACNIGIGQFADSVGILREAIAYLERYGG
jgi:hypothetical protein